MTWLALGSSLSRNGKWSYVLEIAFQPSSGRVLTQRALGERLFDQINSRFDAAGYGKLFFRTTLM